MQIITGTKEFQIEEPTVVTIGKFDGRHKGHQKLLNEMMKFREQYGYRLAVFTFDMAPANVVAGKIATVITTNQERRSNMEKIGVDYLVEYPFDQETAHTPPELFVKKILAGQMKMKAIVAGPDCRFGYKGAGNAELLRRLSDEYGYQTVIIEKEQDHHRDISSTYVREELDQGHIEKVNELLGEPYAIHGIVVQGNHIGGSVLGFPTANILPPPEKHLPKFGVYVSRVLIDGKYYAGVSNVGKKPTVEGEYPAGVETFILDLEENLYGKKIEVQLLHFIRQEQKFDSFDALRKRIQLDKECSAKWFMEKKNAEM